MMFYYDPLSGPVDFIMQGTLEMVVILPGRWMKGLGSASFKIGKYVCGAKLSAH